MSLELAQIALSCQCLHLQSKAHVMRQDRCVGLSLLCCTRQPGRRPCRHHSDHGKQYQEEPQQPSNIQRKTDASKNLSPHDLSLTSSFIPCHDCITREILKIEQLFLSCCQRKRWDIWQQKVVSFVNRSTARGQGRVRSCTGHYSSR